MEPRQEEEGAFSPSLLALGVATKSKTDYKHTVYSNAYKGEKYKVMMVCSEERYMTMLNGKRFSTGNHPVETLVPMLHLEQAGFEVDIYTPTGKPVQLEMWAMPQKDEAVKNIYNKYKSAFENPGSLQEFVKGSMAGGSCYLAVYLPGGHGAMLGLPENEDLGKVVRWAHKQDKFMLSICHGPAALLAANTGEGSGAFVYQGYSVAAFPDLMDKIIPFLGYLPGRMPWYFGEKLKDLGIKVINKQALGTCHQDRKLITGDSPDAANKFGEMVAKALLAEVASK